MPSFGVALAWIIISPLAFLTNCLGLLCILHYKRLYHSCDVAFISMFITMATNVWLLLPIPAVLQLGDFYWSKSLCAFYAWLSVTLRSAHLLVLLTMNVYWMASLRVSPRNKMLMSSKPMMASVCVCWFIAVVIGLIPGADVGQIFKYYKDSTCRFLPASIDRGFAIFFMILSLLSAVMGVISSLDTLLVFKSMKEAALSKYSADRFHVPTVSGTARTSAFIHAKYNELNVSIELCGLVLWFSIASSVVNAIPLLASQFVQLTQEYNRETMETTLLWLLLIESLILPHLLWILSRRYRHAVVYTWRVFVLRDSSFKEDGTADCTLQADRLKVKELISQPYRNGNISQQVNGAARGAGIEDHSSTFTRLENGPSTSSSNELIRNGHGKGRANGGHQSGVVNIEFEDDLTAISHLTSSEIVVLHERTLVRNSPRIHNGDIQETSLTQKTQTVQSARATLPETEEKDNLWKSSTSASPYTSSVKMSGLNGEVKRSTSASSRTEWKARMMKKHLPTVFLRGSLESDTDELTMNHSTDYTRNDFPASNRERENINNTAVDGGRNEGNNLSSARRSSSESTYYISSDYHHNFINDTHGRPHSQASVADVVILGVYEDEDIKDVLDGSLTREQTGRMLHGITDSGHRSLHNLGSAQHSSHLTTPASHVMTSRNIDTLESSSSRMQLHESAITNAFERKNVGNVQNAMDNYIILSNGAEQSHTHMLDHEPVSEGGSSESVSQSAEKSAHVPLGYALIRKGNYRKFLPYTNLIVSNVDDVVEDETNDYDENNGHENKIDVKESPEHVSNSSPQRMILQYERGPDEGSKTSVPLDEPDILRNTHARDENKRNNELSKEDCFQDYSKLETVSGAEMLRLKMKSLRSATAIYNSDDTTSEEGGVDNKGFDDISDDEPERDKGDNSDKWYSSWTHNSQKGSIQNQPDTKHRSPGSGHSSPSASTKDGLSDKAAGEEENAETKRRFDAKEAPSSFFSSSKDNLLTYNMNVFAGNYLSQTDPVQQNPETNVHQPFFISVPQLDTASNISPKKAAPILKPPRHRKNSNDGSLAKMSSLEDKFDSGESNHAVISHDLTPKTAAACVNCKDEDYSEVSDASDCAELESNSSGHSVTIEPYGQRRPLWMDDSLPSSTDVQSLASLDKIIIKRSSETIMDDMSTNFMTNFSRDIAHEVVEYSLDSVSIGEVKRGSHTHQSLPSQYIQKPLVRYDFDEDTDSGFENTLTSQHTQKPLVRYDFDEDTDSGFENTLTMNYGTHSNYYRGINLCFESIKEEPEEYLSDSTASFENSDNGSFNVNKTRAVLPQPSSDGSIKRLSPLDLAQSQNGGSVKSAFSQDVFLRGNDTSPEEDSVILSTSERTSADGSEEILPTHSSNGTSDPWGVRRTSGAPKTPALEHTIPETNVVVKNADITSTKTTTTSEVINNKQEINYKHSWNSPPRENQAKHAKLFDSDVHTENQELNRMSSESPNSGFQCADIESSSQIGCSTISISPSEYTSTSKSRLPDDGAVYF